MKTSFKLLISTVLGFLAGCGSTPSVPLEAVNQALQEQTALAEASPRLSKLPPEVSDVLLPLAPGNSGQMMLEEARYDISAERVKASEFFAGLFEPTAYSVVLHPDIDGEISLDVKQVTVLEVVDIITEVYGFDVRQRGNIFSIFPAGLKTETIAVNYLLMQRDGSTQTSISSGGISQFGNNGGGGNNNFGGMGGFGNNSGQMNRSGAMQNLAGQGGQLQGGMMGMGGGNGTNISTRAQTDFWKQLEETLTTFIGQGNGRKVIVSPQAGLVTVRAMPNELKEVKTFLRTSESNIQRQVILEARIIEVALDDEFQQGINWSRLVANVGSTDLNITNTITTLGNTISGRMGGVTSVSVNNDDFSGVVSMLSTQGDVQVLSSPRVTALNNQKAVIKVGNDEYFVTDVSSQSTITAGATSTAPDIELTPFFSGIALDVTPQIDAYGSVLLHVHPSVIETEEQEKVVTLNQEQFVLPLAQSNIRESDTLIRAKSGEIVVIGGLMQSIVNDAESAIPLLGDIPGVGRLFKNKRRVETKKELIILIKPTVVDSGTWQQQLQGSQQNILQWQGAQ